MGDAKTLLSEKSTYFGFGIVVIIALVSWQIATTKEQVIQTKEEAKTHVTHQQFQDQIKLQNKILKNIREDIGDIKTDLKELKK